MKSKRWVMVKQFEGFPKDSDFELIEEDIPELKDGDVLFEAKYLSVDPYMRPYMKQFPDGSTMIGEQYSKVIASKNSDYKVGKFYLAHCGWRSHLMCNPSTYKGSFGSSSIFPTGLDDESQPDSYYLGALGMPGCTAYFGLIRICDPKPGETVLVNAAAGAVGSLVGQIAKIKGCNVIGFAGTDEKCAWLKELGFDHAHNYKTCDIDSALKESAPNGIDCYFDNVGGDFSTLVIKNHMNVDGRISLCGAIDSYNATELSGGAFPYFVCVAKQLKMQGFLVSRWFVDYPIAKKQMSEWIKQGKLKIKEHITKGFENMPKAFAGILSGENTGKALIEL